MSLSGAGEQEVIAYCREHEHQLSYRAVISTVRELKVSPGLGLGLATWVDSLPAGSRGPP